MNKYLITGMTLLMTGLLVSGVSALDNDSEMIADEKRELADNQAAMEHGESEEMKASLQVTITEPEAMKKSDSTAWGVAYSARAIIKGTTEDSNVGGRVDFVQTGDGVQVVASLSNVTPSGKHGIHIHEHGSCEEGGNAAGGHFNPEEAEHGLLPRDGHGKAHTGDMGNIEINESGSGSLVIFLPGLSLTEGKKNVTGKAVILHEKEDDFGQPTGNAGGRIGCGIITLNN